MRLALVCTLLALIPRLADAAVEVRAAGEGLSVQATAAALSEVLDRVARQTGMRVQYEGAPPRTLVSLAVERPTQAETVMALLEGLGLNYALMLDPAGTQVRTLIVFGAGSSSSPFSARPAPPPPPSPHDGDEPPQRPDAVAPPDEPEDPEPQEEPPPAPAVAPTPPPGPFDSSPFTPKPVTPTFPGTMPDGTPRPRPSPPDK